MIRDEESLSYTDWTSSFLPKDASISRRYHAVSRLTKDGWADNWSDTASYLYFFVVYTVEDSIEREVGKLVTTAGTVDDVIDEWTLRNHDSMGE